jgi:hypothetical protein
MKNASIAALVLSAILVTGCATNAGTQSVNDFGKFTELRKGETSKADIYKNFGQPHEVYDLVESAQSMWRYYNFKMKTNFSTYIPYVGLFTGGNDVNSTKVDFFFGKDNKLINSERSEKAYYQNMWVGMAKIADRTGQVEKVKAEMNALGLPYDEKVAKENAANAHVGSQ